MPLPSPTLPTTNGPDPAHQPMDSQHSQTSTTPGLPTHEPRPQALSIRVPAVGFEAEPPIGSTVSGTERPLPGNQSVGESPTATVQAGRSTALRARVRSGLFGTIPHAVRTFFTREGRELRHIAGIIFRLAFSVTQVVVIIVVLALAGSTFKSKSDPTISEFSDCDKLGIWNALWAVRAAFGCFMIAWEWRRYLEKRRRAERRRSTDLELGDLPPTSPIDPSDQDLRWGTEVRGPLETSAPVPQTSRPIPGTDVLNTPQSEGPDTNTSNAPPLAQSSPERPTMRPARRQEPRQPPSAADALFDRMDTMLTATGLIHFIVNHIWLYTTVRTCRVNDPHVWYLGLGIASLGYMIVLELLLIAFIVFVLGPILLLILNLIMLCLGRPVDRHGNVIVRAEIPKIEQSLIDKIPLVVFIPPIEAEIKGVEEQGTATEPRDPSGSQAAAGAAASKPMASQSSASRTPRFAWFRRHPGKGKAPPQSTMWSDAKLVPDGDPRFEKADHPFVVLESNRASCPICLTEFVEPKRKEGVPPAPPRPKTPEPTAAAVEGPSSSPVEEGVEREAGDGDAPPSKEKKPIEEDAVQTAPEAEEEAGTPGEALRLLACGHVFHIHCLDPWLSKTSGRCPVCNRKVEIPEHMK
ncbi:hypothetical protein FRC05_004942 [Tulasnella sp. 425]|nr:hypothetical protein FRC05_004942 [Tulasnella sp. 425]